MERSDFLGSLSKCDALLSKRFNSDLNDLNTFDTQIREALSRFESLPVSVNLTGATPFRAAPKSTPQDIEPMLGGLASQLSESLDNSAKALSTKLTAFREKYLGRGASYKLPLEFTLLYRCPGCKMVYPKWLGAACNVCDRRLAKDKDVMTIHLLDGTMKDYIRRNVWLEDAVARTARTVGFVNVLAGRCFRGKSGVWHETDVLSVQKGKVLVCECTIESGGMESMSKLYTKMTELSAQRGLFVTAGDIDGDAERFARSYDVVTIQNVLESPSSLRRTIGDVFRSFG
jgi:hypothetical protein